MVSMELSSRSCAEIVVPIGLRHFSGNLGSCLKEVMTLVVYDGEQGIAVVKMQGNWS